MISPCFILATSLAEKIPPTKEYPVASGIAVTQGALLVVTAGKYVECGTDPASVGAVALTPAGADTGGANGLVFNILGRKEFPPLFLQGISVNNRVPFEAPYTGTLPANVGGNYGVTRGTDGIWRVDFAKTINTVVSYVGTRTSEIFSQPIVLVEFMPSVVQPI